MSYKEKHINQLKHAVGAIALAASMLTLSSCNGNNNSKNVDKEQQLGLLDSRPLQVNDKYGTPVILYHVDVPVYTSKGERKKDMSILTRGLKHSAYHTTTKEQYTRKAYINKSTDPVYVKADKNGAIYTERGFAGLFLDEQGKVMIIADVNVEEYIRDLNQELKAENKTIKSEKNNKTNKQKEPMDTIAEALPKDTVLLTDIVLKDSIETHTGKTDSSQNANLADTLNLQHSHGREL